MADTEQAADITALVAALPMGDTIANPYPLYDKLRAHAPVKGYRDYPPGTVPGADEPVNAWVLLDYDHVSKAARDHRTFSSRDPLQESSSAPTLMLVNHDNPEHDRLRAVVNLAFSRKRIEDLSPHVNRMVHDLLDEVTRAGTTKIEVMGEICAVLPARVMVHLLGLPPEIADRFRHWATAFMLSADLTPEERERSNVDLFTYFAGTVTQMEADLAAGADVPDSLMRALLTAEADGRKLTTDEVIRFCLTLVVAGAETTTFLLGNLLHELATMPDMQARLRAEPAKIDAFIDESLRHSGPPQRLFRIAEADTQIGDALIRKGDWVALFFAAANHDPAMFADPQAFDIDRPNLNRQLTFGVGIHHCLGSALARAEARELLRAVLERFGDIQLAGTAPEPQRASLLNHGLANLTLALTPRLAGAAE
ncbi:cytochrome P450 [Pyruvatibacter mobilis]|uniref:cytochrome P450 n=1 Tax=Pyruvatibacter mobilis TaxID=1712261 RepID=UPI003BB03BD8